MYVVAGRAVALVERAVHDVLEADAPAHEVVLHDLRRCHDHARVAPHLGTVVRTRLPGEHDHLVVGHRQRLSVERRVLFDQRLRRRQQEGLPAGVVGQAVRGHQQAHRRLPHARGEADERVVLAGGRSEL